MGDAANPFEAVRAMMLENLDKVQSATQSYLDMVEKAMRGFPGAKEDQITDFKAYLERHAQLPAACKHVQADRNAGYHALRMGSSG